MKSPKLLLSLLLLIGCGGGTSGSGIKTFEGRVQAQNGVSISGVSVTIEETGESTVTDGEGRFTLASEADGPDVAFLVETPMQERRFTLREISDDNARIALNIVFQPSSIDVTHLDLRARFAGLCDHYFENREIIRQANRVPPGTVCSINVEVVGDGSRLGKIPVALEYAACSADSQWNTLALVSTGEGRHQGFAEINFEYKDSKEFCRYRVRVLEELGSGLFVTYPIDTFTEQGYYHRR